MPTSVVIPVRNRPKLVRQAIESAQAQTVAVDEIIVVDDGSSDTTKEVVADLARGDTRIKLIALEVNGGASAARNIGVKAATGDWIAFLDSDDQWASQKHATQLAALAARPGAVAAFTGIRYLYPWGAKDEPLPPRFEPRVLRRMNFLSSTSTAMVRRQALLNVGGFDAGLPSCQDWDLWLRLQAQGEFVLTPDCLVYYTHVDAERISSNREKVLAGHRAVFRRALGKEPIFRTLDIRAYHLTRLAQIEFWDFKNRWASLRFAALSLLIRPSRAAASIAIEALSSARRR